MRTRFVCKGYGNADRIVEIQTDGVSTPFDLVIEGDDIEIIARMSADDLLAFGRHCVALARKAGAQ